MSYLINKQKNECCGCKACSDICPVKAISLKFDENGFIYPIVDNDKCVSCNLCKKVCPIDNYEFQSLNKAFYGTHNNEDVILKSSSGGAFTSIYSWAIKNGYIVYGVLYEEKFQVRYSRATNLEECEPFRKSKYVIADTNNVYNLVLNDVKQGNKVVFSGSPCVCSALKNYFKIRNADFSNIIIVDIVCHGAGNQKLFDDYIKQAEEEEEAEIFEFRFKNKNTINGEYNSRSAFIGFKNGHRYVKTFENDAFLKGYYSRLFYRESCGGCKYARPERVSDLTLADAWHIDRVDKQANPLKGVSLVLVNSSKGETLFNSIADSFQSQTIDFDLAVSFNEQLYKPTSFHINRNKFFIYWEKYGFNKAIEKATKKSIPRKAFGFFKKCIKGLFRKF